MRAPLLQERTLLTSPGASVSPGMGIGGPVPAALVGATDDTPLDHTWSADDLASGGSWYGANLVHVETWTPSENGTVILLAPAYDGASSEVDFYVFEGAPGDVPDLAGLRPTGSPVANSFTPAPPQVPFVAAFAVIAGQAYTLAVANFDGLAAVDRTVSLREWCLSVQPFGGAPQRFSWLPTATGVNAHAEGYATTADGVDAHAEGDATRAEGHGSHAEGASSHAEGFFTHAEGFFTHADVYPGAHAEGYVTLAEGDGAHAEGYVTHADGVGAHGEGDSTLAEGDGAHAEGVSTHAQSPGAHAEGYFTHAAGYGAHAEGAFTHAEGGETHAEGNYSHPYRIGEHAESSGKFSDGSPMQTSNLTLAAETSDATPTALQAGVGVVATIDLPLTETTLSTLTGRVGARSGDGTLAAAWTFEAVIDRAGGTSRLVDAAIVTQIAHDSGAAAWALAVTESDDGAAITVTGEAELTIRWVAYVEIVEVRFGQT